MVIINIMIFKLNWLVLFGAEFSIFGKQHACAMSQIRETVRRKKKKKVKWAWPIMLQFVKEFHTVIFLTGTTFPNILQEKKEAAFVV